MSKKQYIKRHRFIIDKLKRGAASFKEIQQYLQQQSELDEETYTLSLRTFQRDIIEIASIYDIEICSARNKGLYEIIHHPEHGHNDRLMETLAISDALKMPDTISRHIILEKRKPLGTENMHGLLHAIKRNLVVSFVHCKFWEDPMLATGRTVHPLALKEARNRWYVIANDTKDNRIKTFGLDRITNLEISDNKFKYPAGYDPEEAFRYSFGIINEGGPQKVILSFTAEQGRYVKSLPLHHSQKEISSDDNEYVIELYIYPSYDFIMELLSLGEKVKVIEPQSLREEMKRKLQETLALYLSE